MDSVMIETFFDSEGNLLPQLISDTGDGNIRDLIEYIRDPNARNKMLNINQLRKFYDSFLKIYNTKVGEKEKKIQLLMLKANAEYSAKRLSTHRFKDFLKNRINIVIAQEGPAFDKYLRAFKLHFEALVAYYPRKESKNEEG